MSKPSKFFRVAVEGKTFADGRTIERKWLTDIAETYKPETYTAKVNCEHIRGFSPEKPFFSYGTVTAVKAEEIDIEIAGKSEKRMALFAQIEPTPELKRITAAGQKQFTSIEVNPNFAGTGKAYLAGIAATDNPASLGTEVLTFASKASNNLYSTPDETSIEAPADPVPSESQGLIAAFKELLAPFTPKAATPPAPVTPPVTPPAPPPANDNTALTQLTAAIAALPATLEKMASDQAAATQKVADDLAALTTRLASTEAAPKRAPVSGSGNYARTDC